MGNMFDYFIIDDNKIMEDCTEILDKEDKCLHLRKRKSFALHKSFWYCPDCKEEVYEAFGMQNNQ